MLNQSRILPLLLALLILPAVQPVAADWRAGPRDVIVTLKSAERFEGRQTAKRRGLITFETPFGFRTVKASDILARVPSSELRVRYEKEKNSISEKDPRGHEKLAKWCRSHGLSSALVMHLEALLEKDPLDSYAWAVVKKEAPRHRITAKNPHPEGKGRWNRTQADLIFDALKKGGWVKSAMSVEQLKKLPVDAQINEAVKGAERGNKNQRWVGVQALVRAEAVRRVKTLYKTVLNDKTWQVRLVALQSLKKHDKGNTYRLFVRAMLKNGNNDSIRMNAAWALGRLGDRRAVAPLLRAMKATSDVRANRSNFSELRQIAYVKDYDVEVAQTAFIADPVVDIVLDGLVLDVAVISVNRQRSIIGRALTRLSGASLPPTVKAWSGWWSKNKNAYARSR